MGLLDLTFSLRRLVLNFNQGQLILNYDYLFGSSIVVDLSWAMVDLTHINLLFEYLDRTLDIDLLDSIFGSCRLILNFDQDQLISTFDSGRLVSSFN